MRPGTSLLEALLALLLFEFGLLALLGAAIVSARDLGTAARRLRAQTLARNRVERLTVTACTAASGGFARWPGGMTETWRIERAGLVRVVADSVVVEAGGSRQEAVVLRAWSLCAP